MIYPIVNTVSVSLYKPIGTGVQTTFAGIDNYIKLVSVRPWDVRFWGALQHNMVFFLIQFLVQNPIGMMLYLTSLISIPDELIEAARVDGATAWTTFWRIQLPLILPTVGIVAILTY